MTPTSMLFALGVILSPLVVAGHAQAPAGALPAALRAHLSDERLGVVTSIRGLPLGVRDALQTLFESAMLDIAEPGAAFQATNKNIDPGLPTRRLVAAGCSMDHCLVYYERGGAARTWRVALFRWTPAETRFEWGGTAPGGLKSIDEVRAAMMSGAIKVGAKSW